MSEGSRRYSRRLSKAESELWSCVTADIRPMQRHGSQEAVLSQPDELKKSHRYSRKFIKKIIHEQEKQLRILTPIQDIDYRTHAKIRRGRLDVDAKLDLHGLRQDEAQRALTAFCGAHKPMALKLSLSLLGKDKRAKRAVCYAASCLYGYKRPN